MTDKFMAFLNRLTNSELKTICVYFFFSVLIYIILPSTVFNYIQNKLGINRVFTMMIIILLIAIGVYIISSLIQRIYHYILKKYYLYIDEKQMENKLNLLDYSCILILQEFYNPQVKRFKKIAQLTYSRMGIRVLEELEIIKLIDCSDDEYGGFTKNKKYYFAINDRYLLLMNKIANKKNTFMKLITDLL